MTILCATIHIGLDGNTLTATHDRSRTDSPDSTPAFAQDDDPSEV
jgi:hypothetical protein